MPNQFTGPEYLLPDDPAAARAADAAMHGLRRVEFDRRHAQAVAIRQAGLRARAIFQQEMARLLPGPQMTTSVDAGHKAIQRAAAAIKKGV